MTTRLLILWLLAEGPLHGYRIKTILTDRGFALWFALEDAAIYAMLRSLSKQGLAERAGEEREGARPARTLYRITPLGRQALAEELPGAWSLVTPRPEPIHAALAACDELQPAEVRAMLDRRADVLDARSAALDHATPAAPSPMLARRERALLDAERAWLTSEIERHDKRWRTRR
jgi:DNA-binding PadR family transcriptional regulator